MERPVERPIERPVAFVTTPRWPRSLALLALLALLGSPLASLAGGGSALAQGSEGSVATAGRISVPDFAFRDGVEVGLRDDFMSAVRAAVGARTGFEVLPGALITPGVAGSLEADLTRLIADLDEARYGVSGEIRSDPSSRGYLVTALVVDVVDGRASDLLTVPFRAADLVEGAVELADQLASFAVGADSLPAGSATLWITSEPTGATVFVSGARVGATGRLDLLMLAPGRYEIEVRKEGYLPENRTIDLDGSAANLLKLVLTPVSGGSIQIATVPPARVLLGGEELGVSPLSVPVVPGSYELRLERPGFRTETYTVPVRSFRVTRIQEMLEPVAAPLVWWDPDVGARVAIDGVPRPQGYAAGVGPGLVTIEIRDAGGVRTLRRSVPDAEIVRLDLVSGELVPVESATP